MSDTTREAVESLLSLIQHNKSWEGLQEVDVGAYQQAADTLRALLARTEAAEARADIDQSAYDELLRENKRQAQRIEALQAERDKEKTSAFQQGYKNGKAAGDAFGASIRDYIQKLEARTLELEAERDAAVLAAYAACAQACESAKPNYDGHRDAARSEREDAVCDALQDVADTIRARRKEIKS